MESGNKNNPTDKSFERQVFEALKYYGYKVPKSQEDIEQYIRMFGSTKIELPDSLSDAGAIFDSIRKNKASFVESDEIIGMAARRDNGKKIPEHLIKKIKKDIKDGKWLK